MLLFPAQRYASAGISYGPVSVCPSGRIEQVLGIFRGVFRHILQCCKEIKIRYLQNRTKGTSLWNFSSNSGLKIFRQGEMCYQLSSRKVDVRSGRDKLDRRRSTNNNASELQQSTTSDRQVIVCLQHDSDARLY